MMRPIVCVILFSAACSNDDPQAPSPTPGLPGTGGTTGTGGTPTTSATGATSSAGTFPVPGLVPPLRGLPWLGNLSPEIPVDPIEDRCLGVADAVPCIDAEV